MYITGKILDDILIDLYPRLFDSTDTFDSTRGKGLDYLGVLLELTNPRARVSASQSRGKIFTALGEFCWYMRGSQSPEEICYYIPAYKKEVEDCVIKGAYGPRLIGTGTNNKHTVDQIERVIRLLRAKPDTRRAVVVLIEEPDLDQGRKEAPCTTTLQFILRRKKLHLITSMRSNDAYMGLPHDFFCFTMIQEIVARSLGVGVGSYRHFAASLHLYNNKRENAEEYVNEGWQPSAFIMPKMPSGCQFKNLSAFLEVEKAIRLGELVAPNDIILNPYWKDLALMLLHYSWHNKNRNNASSEELINCLSSKYYGTFLRKITPQKAGNQIFSSEQLSMIDILVTEGNNSED